MVKSQDQQDKAEAALCTLSGESEICEQIIEPNREHGYDHNGDIATTLSLSYNRLELKDTYQNEVCPEEFSKTIVEDVEQIAELVVWAKIDVSNSEDILDDLFRALTDYASDNGFHCGADFIPLFEELKIEYKEN